MMPDENLPEKPDKNPGLAKTLDYLNQNPALAKTLDHPLENEHQPEKPAPTAKSPASFQADGVKNTNAIELQGNFEVLLGRFCVQKTLGEGTFGKVYLAKDQQLNRLVAIKISKTKFHDKTLVDSFLNEARMLARLDHPNIVPVHDVGNSESEGFFIVSKYLEGGSLSQAMNRQFADVFWICNTIALIADGLHHAHVRKLVHRDIKPDNILLDNSGNPCIVDFGLALREESFGQGKGWCGTPLYMSPEQASGEGHLVDGRSDIFSLGVILYEMLAGKKPFEHKNQMVLLQMIKNVDAKPLRQINPKINKELERICLKALSRKRHDRYATAADLAADLRSFIATGTVSSTSGINSGPMINSGNEKNGSKSNNPSASDSTTSIKVVYKGLRSFDHGDKDFFLELLPGSRDRMGLPASIRFWKTQIENPSSAFTVGVIYGPSGCGKSSLMKAGIIPNLDDRIIPIYLEATATTTEEAIIRQLRKHLPDIPQELTLVEAFNLIRVKKPKGLNKKILLVLDQFEQWLYANPRLEESMLSRALRQLDGDYFQVILMIRDDFVLAMNRMLSVLEIPILEGVNFSLVDLFDQKHAQKVLTLFGRALECLPEGELSGPQEQFIQKSIGALSVDEKVVPVRLSVFANMMKSRQWLVSSLNSIGGIEGVGVQFLEETFYSSSAPALCKIHQKAARKVLKALLPTPGLSIKGSMLSLEDLKKLSSYADKPRDFDQLLQLLDGDLRLITPMIQEDDTDSKKSYQLAHDYLVQSLQEWLLKKQRETWKGRAELALENRANAWDRTPENRQLPSLPQWFSIMWNVKPRNFSQAQRKMMRTATSYYLSRTFLSIAAMMILVFFLWDGYSRVKAQGLVERLLDSNSEDVPFIVNEISGYRRWADPLLMEANIKAGQQKDERKKMHASLALLPVDERQVDYLYPRLLMAKPNEVEILVNFLRKHNGGLIQKLWGEILNPEKGREERILRVASALAAYDAGGDDKNWEKTSPLIVSQLVRENPAFIGVWIDTLRPVKKFLINPLIGIYNNRAPEKTVEALLATNLLADYAADQPGIIANLILDADPRQFSILFPAVKEHSLTCTGIFNSEINKKTTMNVINLLRENEDKRKSNAAITLARLDQPEAVWPMLKHSPKPQTRSYLIDKIAPYNMDFKLIMNRLHDEKEISIRRALIQSLGEFREDQMPNKERLALIPSLKEIYLTDPDSGLHSSTEWLLKIWGQQSLINQVNNTWKDEREPSMKRQREIKNLLEEGKSKPFPQWYVNSQGQTMVVIPGPVEFMMGSQLGEAGGNNTEIQHKRLIERSFEVSNKAVTLAQYKKFDPKHEFDIKYRFLPDVPALGIDWYMAAEYCNWLSEQEGIPKEEWCFEINRDTNLIRLRQDCLKLKGYRLPTEAEMEYATRAGSVSARYYGDTAELLPKYAWHVKNSTEQPWPVGFLKPNDFGLFDSLGNCSTWCMDEFADYPGLNVVDDLKGTRILGTVRRALRGFSYDSGAFRIRSASRTGYQPATNLLSFGFRIAKTN